MTGALAVDARNDLGEKQATFGIDRASMEDDHSKAQTFALASDVLLVGTALSAGLSTYLTVRYFGSKKQSGATTRGTFKAITVLPMGVGYTRSF